jgi:hypothetical protein
VSRNRLKHCRACKSGTPRRGGKPIHPKSAQGLASSWDPLMPSIPSRMFSQRRCGINKVMRRNNEANSQPSASNRFAVHRAEVRVGSWFCLRATRGPAFRIVGKKCRAFGGAFGLHSSSLSRTKPDSNCVSPARGRTSFSLGCIRRSGVTPRLYRRLVLQNFISSQQAASLDAEGRS